MFVLVRMTANIRTIVTSPIYYALPWQTVQLLVNSSFISATNMNTLSLSTSH